MKKAKSGRAVGSSRVRRRTAAEELNLQRQTYRFCRDEILREVVFPVVETDHRGPSDEGEKKRAARLKRVAREAGEILDRNVVWVCQHIRVLPERVLTAREKRAAAALGALRLALSRFNDLAESFQSGRKKDRDAGIFESTQASEAAVGAVYVFTRKLVGARPLPVREDTVHWAAAQHALEKHKDRLEPRALLVLDVDRYRGLLGSPWVNPDAPERERIPAPHLSPRHLAMLSILAGNWPEQPKARTPYEIVTAERKAIRKQLEVHGLGERPRAERKTPVKERPTRRPSVRDPRHPNRIPAAV